MRTLETDYLVVGAGAAGMGFADVLVHESPYDVLLVDRRHQPGGHWNDAYPFVRLHLPSAYYGVASRTLGADRVDEHGENAGRYERASGAEVVGYFQRVLEEDLLPTGRLRFLGLHDYVPGPGGEHVVRSRLTGEAYEVRVRRKVVDATYLENAIPATHTPSFTVGPDVRLVRVGDLPTVDAPRDRYVVLGAGKTAMDACCWLLDHGVDPDRIRWVRPRDMWVLDRAGWQPLDQVWTILDGYAHELEALADATGPEDLFERLEERGRVLRLDPDVVPEMYHCASVSRAEQEVLRRVTDVVRLGRVRRLERDRMVLDRGEVSSGGNEVYVDCTARALRQAPPRPVFEDGRVTLQMVRYCSPPFNAALLGYVEATRDDVVEQNRLAPPNPYPDTPADLIRMSVVSALAQQAWHEAGDVARWVDGCRLNVTRGTRERAGDPRVARALARTAAAVGPALANAQALLAARATPGWPHEP